ncbi:MAG: hypothetical protein C5B50_17050 [Verrucomicrobia bacterium]|nr:MAG: hypothetical protein C5B50_17050 [Verrucomicrobiota bacterium]
MIEVLFTPADFAALRTRDLSNTVCVVFDVLRATSSIVTALGNGASGVLPVEEIPEALKAKRQHPEALLAGERDGLRIPASMTGGVEFDLGNSPREFAAERVRGKTIVMTTTNGTRALKACAKARAVLVASFLNLEATVNYVESVLKAPGVASSSSSSSSPNSNSFDLLLVCSGTFERTAYEDTLAAGAFCDALVGSSVVTAQRALPHPAQRDGSVWSGPEVADSALIAWKIYQSERDDLPGAIAQSRNGRRLLSLPDLREDVPFCLRRDVSRVVAELAKDGVVRALAR